jgi:stage V sporulation protein D (sporulation-specific penicillin-binding protein)
VLLYTEESAEDTQVEVPDVIGLSGQQANRTILNAGLNIKIEGTGIESGLSVAVAQDPAAGSQVPPGTVVTVTFAESAGGTATTTP